MGRSGTAAGDEADRDPGAAAAEAGILERHGDERLARGVEIGLERGERRVGEGAGADAVEADQRDVARNVAPRFLEPLKHAEREHVARGENAVDVGMPGEQVAGGGDASSEEHTSDIQSLMRISYAG